MWEPIQAELDTTQAIAMQFSAHPEIQLRLARCLLISITRRNKHGLNIQEEENSPFATPTKVSVPFNYAAVPPNPHFC